MIEKYYVEQMINFWSNFDFEKVNSIYTVIKQGVHNGKTIFLIGNGGSCAIASHMMTDYLKGGKTKTNIKPKIISLVDNNSLITAISNDLSFENIFVYQLDTLFTKGDILISITSSGNSKNIIEGIKFANNNGITTISLTGFSGGKVKEISKYNFHVPIDNYGIVEDIHQSILHMMVQKLRYDHKIDDSIIY